MWSKGHPLVMQFLEHERGRLWTFGDCTGYNGTLCRAMAGFIDTGKGTMQCIYCQHELPMKSRHEDFVMMHRAQYPQCPFMQGAPVANIGTACGSFCCMPHERGSRLIRRQRAQILQNPSGYASYLLAILNLLLILNLTPVMHIHAKVGVATLDPWKGIVGIKTNSYLMPNVETTYELGLKLSACETFETNLKNTFDSCRTTTSDNTAYGTTTKQKITEYVTSIKAHIGVKGVKALKEQIPVISSTVTDFSCPKFPNLIGAERCQRYERWLALIKDSLNTLLAQPGSGITAMGVLTGMTADYLADVQKLRDLLNDLEIGSMPVQLASAFEGTCTTSRQSCYNQTDEINKEIARKWSRVNKIGRLQQENMIIIGLTTPCIHGDDITSEYQVYTLPYEENGKLFRLSLPDMRVGIQTSKVGEENQGQLVPVHCQNQDQADQIQLCSPHQVTSERTVIRGSKDQVQVRAKIRKIEEDFKLIDLPRNQFLLFTADPVRVISECPPEPATSLMAKGSRLLSLGAGCTIRIPEKQIQLHPNPIEKFASDELMSVPNNNVLTFPRGQLANDLQDFEQTEILMDHLETYSNIYVGTIGGMGVVSVLCLMMCQTNSIRIKRRRARRQQMQPRYVMREGA